MNPPPMNPRTSLSCYRLTGARGSLTAGRHDETLRRSAGDITGVVPNVGVAVLENGRDRLTPGRELPPLAPRSAGTPPYTATTHRQIVAAKGSGPRFVIPPHLVDCACASAAKDAHGKLLSRAHARRMASRLRIISFSSGADNRAW